MTLRKFSRLGNKLDIHHQTSHIQRTSIDSFFHLQVLCFITASETLLNSFLGNGTQCRRRAQQKHHIINTVRGDSWILQVSELVLLVRAGKKGACFCLISSNATSCLENKLFSSYFLQFFLHLEALQFAKCSLANHFSHPAVCLNSVCVYSRRNNPFVQFSPSQGPLNI